MFTKNAENPKNRKCKCTLSREERRAAKRDKQREKSKKKREERRAAKRDEQREKARVHLDALKKKVIQEYKEEQAAEQKQLDEAVKEEFAKRMTAFLKPTADRVAKEFAACMALTDDLGTFGIQKTWKVEKREKNSWFCLDNTDVINNKAFPFLRPIYDTCHLHHLCTQCKRNVPPAHVFATCGFTVDQINSCPFGTWYTTDEPDEIESFTVTGVKLDGERGLVGFKFAMPINKISVLHASIEITSASFIHGYDYSKTQYTGFHLEVSDGVYTFELTQDNESQHPSKNLHGIRSLTMQREPSIVHEGLFLQSGGIVNTFKTCPPGGHFSDMFYQSDSYGDSTSDIDSESTE